MIVRTIQFLIMVETRLDDQQIQEVAAEFGSRLARSCDGRMRLVAVELSLDEAAVVPWETLPTERREPS